jgi:predicted dehydrogenase
MKHLRVAVIGCGRLGGFHARKLAAMPGIELVAVVDPVAARRDRVAADCQTAGLADYGSLLGKIDAAVIAAPTALHRRIALDCLAAKTHLLVEKPLCVTYNDAQEVVEAARRQQVVLQVGHVERFNPALTAAAPHVRNPRYIEAVRAGGCSLRSLDVGVVLDLMIHDIDLVLSLVPSRLRNVEATGFSVLGGHEDVASAWLEFECGCVASLWASRVSCEPARHIQICSPRAMARVDFATCTTTLVRPSEALLRRQFHPEDLTPEEVEQKRAQLVDEHLPKEQQRFEAVDALAHELQDFVESILTPREPRVSGEAGRDAVGVAQRILARIDARAATGSTAEPLAAPLPLPRVIPPPHFDLSAERAVLPLREKAG